MHCMWQNFVSFKPLVENKLIWEGDVSDLGTVMRESVPLVCSLKNKTLNAEHGVLNID